MVGMKQKSPLPPQDRDRNYQYMKCLLSFFSFKISILASTTHAAVGLYLQAAADVSYTKLL